MRLKLVSRSHDTLLGHIDVPDFWQEWFDRGGTAVQPIYRPLKVNFNPKQYHITEIQKIVVAKAYGSQYRDAVYLAVGSIEEFEQQPGCSFSPSMSYLKSHME